MKKLDFSKYNWEKRTILIVEDTETSNEYFKAAFKNTYVNIYWAKNGLQAVEMAQEHNDIDAIIMDVNLPKMNGIEATKRIKIFKPDVPIIVQTAYLHSNEEEYSKEAGCDEFITKPIKLTLLFAVLDKYLKRLN
ncbi:response regulator [Bacteroidota bacterium]